MVIHRLVLPAMTAVGLFSIAFPVCAAQPAAGPMPVNIAGVIGRSDIVLAQPNSAATEAMPLGNGRLGVAVWSSDGLTAQLNRADTMPYRYSTGQLVLPGLARLTTAADYRARLNLYTGTFEESGNGIHVRAYVQPKSDLLIVDVSGVDPEVPQKAILRLWKPRQPTVTMTGTTGTLAESWLDNRNPGASGERFGSLAAITGEGAKVSAEQVDQRTVSVSITPNAQGSFRVLVASPAFAGGSTATTRALLANTMRDRSPLAHEQAWREFWRRADTMKITSADGAGEYMENLRAIYLYSAEAESGGRFPGSQAGVGDLFSSVRDEHQWDPSAFWHWNLRMQVAANLGAGLPELNLPYFRLYRDNLDTIEQWTQTHMGGAPGVCIPETMRFDGKGIEFETWGGNTKVSGWNCDLASAPYYNARTISIGAEVSLWIWRQYQLTGDRAFLEENFPVMAESARFLLSYAKPGDDGLLHTSPSNAHETQWDVLDPVTDLAARRALFPATIAAATVLHQEPAMVARMRTAPTKIPAWPRVRASAPTVLPTGLDSDAEANTGDDVIAPSWQPGAVIHNMENIGLEPVWPYDLITDASPFFALALRTYFARPTKAHIDWSFDPVQAARLGLGEEVRLTLIDITRTNQKYINGFAKWEGVGGEFYVEQTGVVSLALEEALVSDPDGLIRVAPAVPGGWDMDGSVSVQGETRVDVEAGNGAVRAVGFRVGQTQTLKVRNPWPGQAVRVSGPIAGNGVALEADGNGVLSFAVVAGHAYRLFPVDGKNHSFAPVEGRQATAARRLGPVQIGLLPASDR